MNLAKIRIVLIATSHPGNIGSSARAMKTMGLERLYLVMPKSFPDQKAYEMAAGAGDVLNHAVVTHTLDEALAGCQLIVATSARARSLTLPGLTPKTCAELVCAQSEQTEVAILFGREHAGLTNEELLRSHYHVCIPSNPDYSSLNLAQAVQIISYELRMKLLAPVVEVALRPERAATAEEIEQFYAHLTHIMIAIHFLKPANPKRLLERMRRLFNRVRLERTEVSLLRGFLSRLEHAFNNREIR